MLPLSFLQTKRLAYVPKLPQMLRALENIRCESVSQNKSANPDLKPLFPHLISRSAYHLVHGQPTASKPLKVGVIFSGGPAAGGHNVLAGLFDALQSISPQSTLLGFKNGFSGMVDNKVLPIDRQKIDAVRNQGGFDLIGSSRTKLETREQMEKVKAAALAHQLDAFVIIGGDDSNTNGAILAEYLLAAGSKTRVIGVPKTIDGDLRSEEIEISFGFDSAAKTYSELIGNIALDAKSAGKYYHFIKLMGRSASHVALECALVTQPNLVIIGEEGKHLEEIIDEITNLILRRKAAGKEYGVILISEGLIEFIPEIKELIAELNPLLAKQTGDVEQILSEKARKTFLMLPEKIRRQLLIDRDPHGNVNVSLIETEQLLIELVKPRLSKEKGSFTPIAHFFGYEGRCCFPSNFDANYAYALGVLAALGVRDELTGVICAIRHLHKPIEQWEPTFASLVPMMHMEMRKGEKRPVIQKALVNLKGKAFQRFAALRKTWELDDLYQSPGPIQFFGPSEITESVPMTLQFAGI